MSDNFYFFVAFHFLYSTNENVWIHCNVLVVFRLVAHHIHEPGLAASQKEIELCDFAQIPHILISKQLPHISEQLLHHQHFHLLCTGHLGGRIQRRQLELCRKLAIVAVSNIYYVPCV